MYPSVYSYLAGSCRLFLLWVALVSTAAAQTAAPLYRVAGPTTGRALHANAAVPGRAGDAGRTTPLDAASLAAFIRLRADTQVVLPVNDHETVTGTVHLVRHEGGLTRSGGTLTDGVSGTFYLSGDGTHADGFILRPDRGLAYRFETLPTGRTVLREVPINAVECGQLPRSPGSAGPAPQILQPRTAAVPVFNSRPDAVATLYLDFDGETVTDPSWAGGQTIVAAAYNLPDNDIRAIIAWVGEDYRPFNINVTSDLARYNAAPVGRRMRCIVTPTNTAAPGAGGVAYLTSFWNAGPGHQFDSTIPCWVFNSDVSGIALAASHEAGHTFGLRHDGRELPNSGGGTTHEEYFQGQGTGATSWCPIMGAGYSVRVVQFSKGEYQYANNQEDDLATIADSDNGFGYATDEPGTSPATAPALGGDTNGNVGQSGVIAVAGDADDFALTTTGGTATIQAAGAATHSDLDIALELQDKNGNVVASSNPATALSASLTATLARGTYYLKVTDSGAMDTFTTGYSTYGSIGEYDLTGTVPGLGVTLFPNLAFVPPTGATSPLVITNTPGSRTDATAFYATDPLYLSFAVNNGGEADVKAAFTTAVYVDDVLKATIPAAVPLPTGGTNATNDFLLGNLPVGAHTIRLVADAGSTVGESNENDNVLSRTINVTVAGPPTVNSAATASGQVGAAFVYQITASNAPTSYAASGLPAGLSLKAGSALIVGTPTVAGTFPVTVSATNVLGTGTTALTLSILPGAPVLTATAAADAEVGAAYAYQIPATNAPTGYAATGLPPGLSLDGASGIISGVPTTAGAYSVAVRVGNAGGAGNGTLALRVQGPAPVIASAASATGRVSTPFAYQIAASNTPTGYGATGLPAGLSVNAATGLISGTPAAVGTYTVTISATNATRTVSLALTLTIDPAPPLVAWGASAQTGVPADLTNNVVGIAAGAYHSLALRADGTVEGWGANDQGQTSVPAGLGNVVSVAAGAYHSLALRADGAVTAWGSDNAGQTTVPAGLDRVVAVSGGGGHSLALRADGTVVAWGDDTFGQAKVPEDLADVIGIAAGETHSLALRADGSVVAWGSNLNGQLNIPGGLTGISQVAAGSGYSVLLRRTGSVLVLGSNSGGQLNTPAGLANVVAVAAGRQHVLAKLADGSVVAWGSNTQGESTPPTPLQSTALLAAGYGHSLALTQTGMPRAVAALPTSNVGFNGGTVWFFADAVSAGTPTFQWSFNGVDLPGQTLPFLVLDNVQPEQAGSYAFRVTNAAGSVTSAPASLSLTEAVPMVSVVASVKAVPYGVVPFAQFTFTRTGDTSKPLVVRYALKGSAVNGTDYALLSGSKKLKAGKASKAIKLVPLVNAPTGTKKTVALTLLPGDGYTLGTTKPLKVKLVGTGE